MATLKQRLHRMNNSGSYDVVHFETQSDVVLRPDGTTAEDYFTAPTVPVLTSDPPSPKEGQIWILNN